LKYKNKTEWKTNSSGSYRSANKNGWLDECTKHMEELIKPNRYWTKERCIEEALKYGNKSGWNRYSSGSYKSARRNDWMDECTKHMKNGKEK
jgi:hypothetical protein